MRMNVPSVAPQFLRSRIGKVCVAVIGSTAAEMLEKAHAVAKETSFLEFRLDYLEKPLLALPKLKQFLAENNAVTAIATCRRTANGGKFSGNVAAEIEILSKAAATGFHIVDVEPVEVPGHAAEVDNVRLGDRAVQGDGLVTRVQVLPQQTLFSHAHLLRSGRFDRRSLRRRRSRHT